MSAALRNYVSEKRCDLRNFMSADNQAMAHRLAEASPLALKVAKLVVFADGIVVPMGRHLEEYIALCMSSGRHEQIIPSVTWSAVNTLVKLCVVRVESCYLGSYSDDYIVTMHDLARSLFQEIFKESEDNARKSWERACRISGARFFADRNAHILGECLGLENPWESFRKTDEYEKIVHCEQLFTKSCKFYRNADGDGCKGCGWFRDDLLPDFRRKKDNWYRTWIPSYYWK